MRRMHRNVKAASVGAGLALLLVLAAYFYFGNTTGSEQQRIQATTLPQPAAPATVERGAYLARLGNCALCHTARGGTAYAGGVGVETPFGTVFSSNITPDKAQGIGAWSAQDFWGALHEGRSRDGHLLYPAFPYTSYTHVTHEDSDALYSYLQTVPASQSGNVAHTVRWPFNTQAALAVWRSVGFTPASQAAAPVATESAEFLRARGAYLVLGLGHCAQCHSPRNFLGAIKDSAALSGGTLATGNWYAPSLLDPREAAVAHWSVADIVSLLKTGTSAQGQANGPMADVVLHSTQYLTDQDAQAVAHYLQTLSQPEARPAPDLPKPQTTAMPAKAAALYDKHCADCHGKSGEGQAGAYPALASNRAVNRSDTHNLVQMLLYGAYAPATQGNPRPYGMPPFVLLLGDQELAAVLTYIRGSWGNTGAAVSEFDINKALRHQHP
ncbi:MAG: hypothetical protein RIR45_1608 [Pseudomonadota bacterium]